MTTDLVSFKAGEPDWPFFSVYHIQDIPLYRVYPEPVEYRYKVNPEIVIDYLPKYW